MILLPLSNEKEDHKNSYKYLNVVRIDDDRLLAKNLHSKANGATTPMFTVIDNNYREISLDSTIVEQNTIFFPLAFSKYGSTTLFWSISCDTIYQIDPNFEVKSRYIVDFGRYSVPVSIQKKGNAQETLSYLFDNEDSVATFVHYVHENDDYMLFSFAFKNDNHYYALYDKSSGTSKAITFSLEDDTLTNISALYSYDDYFITLWESDGNPQLVFHKF